jgi:deoxyribonuclease V
VTLAAVDVDYRGAGAVAACVLFGAWRDAAPAKEIVERVAAVAAYQPGAFYLRELPCILQVLKRVPGKLDVIVVDGYVWLARGKAGLGAKLYEALGGSTPVVGVAKTAFRGNDAAREVLRGGSARALFVTAVGMDVGRAAAAVSAMHGRYRMPTMLSAVDRLARA